MNLDFAKLRQSLTNIEAGRGNLTTLVALWRQSEVTALPERFGVALDTILMRMESGSLFDEDGCSFSQHDMVGALRHWLQRAEQVIADQT